MCRISTSQSRLLAVAGVVVLFAFTVIYVRPWTRSELSIEPPAEDKPALLLQGLPLSFEVNLGQADPRARFIAQGPGYSLHLMPNKAAISVAQRAPGAVPEQYNSPTPALVVLSYLGANPAAELAGGRRLPGVVNYFLGNNPANWRTNIPTFAEVRSEDVWPGVDLVYYGVGGTVEMDLVVDPGIDPSVIQLGLTGAEVQVVEDGALALGATGLRMLRPSVYQNIGGERHAIKGDFVVRDGGVVGFDLGPYDRAQPLVIDPILTFLARVGSSLGDDHGYAIATDGQGNAYITGMSLKTLNSDFPLTNPAQPSVAYGENAFVAKINPAGNAVVYASWIGGGDWDEARGIAVDAQGNAYVAGMTRSTDFPTVGGAFDTTPGNSQCDESDPWWCPDAFVFKLSPSGSALSYSTYLGGEGGDYAWAIAVDASGNAFIAGQTDSIDFPLANAYDSAESGFSDAFVTKLNPAGSAPVFSTYLGGSANEDAYGIALDTDGNTYVVGKTNSADFPTQNAFQNARAGAGDNAFVTKLNPAGSSLAFSTFLGGSANGQAARGVAVDANRNVYVTGWTYADNFPTTANSFMACTKSTDAFVTKFTTAGNTLAYSTCLGGSSGQDAGNGIAVDKAGLAYVVGTTDSCSFPVKNPIQTSCEFANEAFVTQLSANGKELLFSTYLGGTDFFWGDFDDEGDQGYGIAVDAGQNAYVVGQTNSSDLQTTSGSIRPPSLTNYYDAFLLKLALKPEGGDPTATPSPTRTPTATPTPTPTASPTPRPLVVESIVPASAGQGADALVTIYGYGFKPGASVAIGSRYLRDIDFLGAESTTPHRWRLRGTLPGGLEPGTYDVSVINPDGKSADLRSGFTVTTQYGQGVGGATVSFGANQWHQVRSSNYPTVPVMSAGGQVIIEIPVYGPTPASITLIDGHGAMIGLMTRSHDIEGGSVYVGSTSVAPETRQTGFLVRVRVVLPNGSVIFVTVFSAFIDKIDPSGRVYDAGSNASLQGATVTLWHKQGGGNALWNPAVFGQINPQTTGDDGRYGWETSAGTFFVTASRRCYLDRTSPLVTVPPEVTDLDIGLQPTSCSPIWIKGVAPVDLLGMATDLVAPDKPLSLEALVEYEAGRALAASDSALGAVADYRLQVFGPDGLAVPELSESGEVLLLPGQTRLYVDGKAPAAEGDYVLGAWVTFDDQTSLQASMFHVGTNRAESVQAFFPLLMRP